MSVTLRLEDELDVSRGELICRPDEAPTVARELEADVCWMSERAAARRRALPDQAHHPHRDGAIVDELDDLVDVHTLERDRRRPRAGAQRHRPRTLRTSSPLAFDPYARNRRTGSFILIDESTNETVGAGMIARSSAERRALRAGPARAAPDQRR